MFIHESPLLLPGLLAAQPEDKPIDPSPWRVNEEVLVREAGGELLLRQDSRTLRLRLTPLSGPLEGYAQDQTSIWVLARVKPNLISLRCARPSQSNSLERPLEIGVDQRVADDLHQQRKTSAPTVAAAMQWLTDEFVCERQGFGGDLVFAAILPRAKSGQLQLVGRAWLVDIRRANDGTLLVERVRRRNQKSLDAYAVLVGEIRFVDLAAGIRVQDGDERAMLEASVSSYGTYLELWQLYSDMEWRREVQTAAELGALRYTRCEPASAEGGAWRFFADPAELGGFQARWRSLAQQDDASVEAEEAAPDWGDDRYTDLSTSDTHRRFRGAPEFREGTLLAFGRSPIDPPSAGFLFLSLGGDRKQHERRLHARRAIEAGMGVPRLRSLLQDLPIPGQRPSRLPALTPYARQSFKSGKPTAKQELAIQVALNTPDVALIIGPPGTGKTQVIAALERRLAEINEGQVIAHEVLISSFQHDAVENALERTSVYGLPAIKVGNRSGASDAVDHWCAARHESVSQRLDQLAIEEPHVPLLQRLNRMVMGLRLTSMPSHQREGAFQKLNELIEELAQKARIRLSSRWVQDWEEYLARRHCDDLDVGSQLPVGRRRRITRLARSLRVLSESFADDGAFRAGSLLSEAGAQPGLLTQAQIDLLTLAQNEDLITDRHLSDLAELRDQVLDLLRPDNRPAAVRHQLDEEGVRLLDRLQTELASKVAATRFGRYDVLQRYRDAFDSSRDRVRRAVEAYSSIVGATCQQAASHHMSRLKSASADEAGTIRFNTVIIDEAARANPLDLFIPMSMAKRRIVLVGDHRQLPHLLDAAIEDDVVRAYGEEDRRQVYQQSLFERLWRQLKARETADGFSRVVMLDTQFRMHPTLGDFVSKNFYESVGLGKIESGRKAEDFVPTVPGFGAVACAWIDVPARLGREERASSSRQRICEASRIAKEVRTLLSQLPPDMSVGVITFYAAQRDRIFEALCELGIAETGESGWQIKAEHAGNSTCPERLRVGTVDAFQGKEFDIVLLSVVRSNDLSINAGADDDPAIYEKAASRRYGHLRVSNRLNVAMSRQRRLLIAVGDREMFVGIQAQRAVPEMAAFVDLCDSEARHVR
jgi:hypothetical protein